MENEKKHPDSASVAYRKEFVYFPEGYLAVYWPSVLSEESLRDFLDWVELFKRRVSRHSKIARMPLPEPPKPE